MTQMPDTEHSKLHNQTDATGATILRYWPIIIAGAATLISLGGIFVKLDYIAKAIDRTDTQFTQINTQLGLTGQSIVEMRGQIARVQEDNVRHAQNIAKLEGRLDLLSDKARWAPGAK